MWKIVCGAGIVCPLRSGGRMDWPRMSPVRPRRGESIRRLQSAVMSALEPRLLFTGTHPLSSLPALSSLPGAFAKLYLDFDGDPLNHDTPAYDADGDPSTFADAELAAVRAVWARVA